MSQIDELIDEKTHRGHRIEVWRTPDNRVRVTSNIRDDAIETAAENQDWAVFAMAHYINGWKDAGGN